MSSEDYKVLMKLSLINEISPQLTFISKQLNILNKEGDVFITKMNAIKSSSFNLFGTAAAFAAPIVYGITKAAELQKNMLGIQVATNGTVEQMDKLRLSIENASVPTQFNALQMSAVAQKIATSNSFSAPQLSALMPTIAKFVDVQSLLKNTDPMSSAVNAVQMMHLAQKYNPNQVEPYFNEITKVSLMMPGGVSELRSAMSYSQPILKAAFGIDDTHNLMMVALLSRLGLKGSRGGTNLAAAITRTIPGIFGSGLLKGKSHEALADMGFIDKKGHSKFMENGKFNMDDWVMGLSSFAAEAIAKDPKHGRERIAIDFQHAFGVQGGKVASLLSSPAAIAQLASMNADFKQLASMGAIQDKFVKESASQQFQSALTNIQNIFIELGYNLLPLTLRVLKDINNELAIFIPWMRAHKTEVKELGIAFLKVAAALAIVGTVKKLASAFTLLSTPLGATLLILTQWQTALKGYQLLIKAVGDGFEWWFNKIEAFLSKIGFMGAFHSVRNSLVPTLPDNSKWDPNYASNQAMSSAIAKAHQQTLEIHTHHHMDSKEISHTVTKIQAKQANRQPSHGSLFNPNISLQPNMLNYGGSL